MQRSIIAGRVRISEEIMEMKKNARSFCQNINETIQFRLTPFCCKDIIVFSRFNATKRAEWRLICLKNLLKMAAKNMKSIADIFDAYLHHSIDCCAVRTNRNHA